MTEDTYSVELTYSEWMTIATALGLRESTCRIDGLEGEANKCNALVDKIAEELSND